MSTTELKSLTPDPYDQKQEHIISEILEDQKYQIQKQLERDAGKARFKNGYSGKEEAEAKKPLRGKTNFRTTKGQVCDSIRHRPNTGV
jgi:hypothetical protein